MENKLRINIKLRYIICFISIIVFCIILINVLDNDIKVFDNMVYSLISPAISDKLTIVARILTEFAGVPFFIAIILGILLKKRSMGHYSIYILLNIAIATFLNQAIKFIVARQRPEGISLIKQGRL